MRDSISLWVADDRGAWGSHGSGSRRYRANWEAHGDQVNVAFADGRVYRLRETGEAWAGRGPEGRPTVLGTGGLHFRCIEPFRPGR